MKAGRRSARGFTLIELVILIVVMAVAAASMMSMNIGIFSGQTDSQTMEVGAGLMQECAEMILAQRQKNGFSAAALADSTSATTLCAGAAFASHAAPTVTVTDASSSSACPTGGECKQYSIAQGGVGPVVLILAK